MLYAAKKALCLIMAVFLLLTSSRTAKASEESSGGSITVRSVQEDPELFLEPEDLFEASFADDLCLRQFPQEDTGLLPSSWDQRWVGLAPPVRDQYDLSTCWAFAGLSAFQAALLPEETHPFSVDHLLANCGYPDAAVTGGIYPMILAYLSSWRGPVYEEDDPYADGYTSKNAQVCYHLQEARFLNGDAAAVKAAVLLYGAVQTSLYADPGLTAEDSSNIFYNPDTASYFYNGSESANHDVIIIGWDDTYPASNFSIAPPHDGAFLCQNSWGSSFGDQGCFYVSYYDTRLLEYAVAYTGIESISNYDRLYEPDPLGWQGMTGYDQTSAWGANVYTSEENEQLRAVSFYAVAENVSYEIYVDTNPENTSDGSTALFSPGPLLASGCFSSAGYYTVKLSRPVSLVKGQTFAVIIKVTLPSAGSPLAVDTSWQERTGGAAGQSYISPDGVQWTDLGSSMGCSLCLKAFTCKEDQ